jgi:hypothetical protein
MEQYSYNGGYFVNLGDGIWEEYQNSQKVYDFVETQRDNEWITINDASRNITVALPIVGGKAYYVSGDNTNWTELFDVSSDVIPSANIRDKAKEILDHAVPEDIVIKSNEAPPQYNNAFLQYTGTSHSVLLANWQTQGIMTACNGFVNWYARSLGINDISNWFSLKESLERINKLHAWVESSPDTAPQYGDILKHKIFHVDVAIGFNDSLLRRVAAGQSYHKRPASQEKILQEYDVLTRVTGKAPYSWQNLEGWLDIERYFG